jgi:hypothetical protein
MTHMEIARRRKIAVSFRHAKRPFPQIIEPIMTAPIKDPFDSPD